MVRVNSCHPELKHYQHGLCRSCYNKKWDHDHPEWRKVWRAKNRDKIMSHNLKRRFGITLADYLKALEDQGGGCAICKTKSNENGRNLHVDHDHKTGAFRGILCATCNQGLGQFKDNPQFLLRAVKYLGGVL